VLIKREFGAAPRHYRGRAARRDAVEESVPSRT
jgi:hypothetical protein